MSSVTPDQHPLAAIPGERNGLAHKLLRLEECLRELMNEEAMLLGETKRPELALLRSEQRQ